ncbi:MAG TPA: class I SAM-dependent methyltransferase [Gemmatimonadales bacterium]|nr:class I SAM-dependent methyltransferase [Gemmatimonadales bacterium]
MSIQLPRRGHLPRTGPVDAIDQYYTPVLGAFFRRRLAWVDAALPPGPLGRVLEIGYGSGVFQYTLAPRARLSVGLDIHPFGAKVRRRLAEDGIAATLLQGDGCVLPFAGGSFDVVVILSALEFVPDPAACLDEAVRVLAPGGRVVCIRPRVLPWADAIYGQLVGFDPEAEFQGGRQRVQAALARVRAPQRRLARPAWLPPALAPYEVVVLETPARRRVAGASPVGGLGGLALGT